MSELRTTVNKYYTELARLSFEVEKLYKDNPHTPLYLYYRPSTSGKKTGKLGVDTIDTELYNGFKKIRHSIPVCDDKNATYDWLRVMTFNLSILPLE